eukprot:CAMPEP_0118947068 /NCGR_PEP_ID=MMETSP1169-20130426/45317_1 /TAXON_ID=36882 /ORGANISM="Pyramimonas obovata, Strain CCMP722" /LENGTH=1143 /DNA_ID=CAMNT_0006893203 /DNA_START=136 /DNA_END=3568 /DNA_ORIENTATION=+
MKTERNSGAAAGPSKKARVGGGDVDVAYDTTYLEDVPNKGSVLRVKMVNFMTYGNVEFVPGRRLNLILGPNGTGKSSFVCAICIGLGGKPSLLGRGDKVSEFIKRGENTGEVEITLCTGNPQRPLVIHRKIKQNNSSEWKLNGHTVDAKKVLEQISELNVQLDNLCQFLPQDRVVAFSQLKPTELLMETEKAIGDAHLRKMHQDLIDMRNDIKGLGTRVQEHRQQLERYQEQNRVLERDVERVNERNRLYALIEELEKKKPWLKFEIAKDEWENARVNAKRTKNQMKEKEKQLQIARKPLTDKMAQRNEADKARKAIKLEEAQLLDKRQAVDEDLLKMGNNIEAVQQEIQNLQNTARQREAKMAKARAEIADLEAQISALPEPEDSTEEADRLKVDLRRLNNELKELGYRKTDTQHAAALPQRQLGEISAKLRKQADVRNQRIRALANKDPQGRIIKACEWVEANRSRFVGEVYGPILAEVHVNSKQHATYLEQHCPGWLWEAFVTTNAQDQTLLLTELRQHGTTVINYSGDPSVEIPEPHELEGLKQYGIQGTLDMVVEAPMVVKRILNDHAATARTYIGTQETESRMEEVAEIRAISCVFTPVSQYTYTTSRYSNARTSRVVAVRPPKLFLSSVDQAQVDLLKQQQRDAQNAVHSAEQQLAKIEEETKATDAALRAAREETSALLQRKSDYNKQVSKLKQQVNQKQVSLKALEKTNAGNQEEKLRKRCATINEKRLDKLLELHSMTMRMGNLQLQSEPLVLKIAECEVQIEHLKQEVSGLEAEGGQLAVEHEQHERKKEERKQRALELKKEAERVANLAHSSSCGPDGNRTCTPATCATADLEAKFEQMPGTLEELQDEIKEKNQEAEALFIRDPDVLNQYQERKKKIEDLESKLAAETDLYENGQSKIDELKGRWLPELKEVVEQMGRTFSESFAAIGCVGELGLEEHENFESYEMRIRVKFRAEEALQTLSSHRQSGGERSVSTMLYLIALQEFTKCPFRVVDEINQGMDAVNERKIFTKMVEAACRPDTPQCFLLTPKLLPQLEYSPAVTILNIMNGPRIKKVSSTWDPSRSYKFYKPNPSHAAMGGEVHGQRVRKESFADGGAILQTLLLKMMNTVGDLNATRTAVRCTPCNATLYV